MILWIIVVGFIVGAIAKFLMPGPDPGGIVVTILLGIGGAMLANWLGAVFGLYIYGDGAGLVSSVIGAVALLAIYRATTRGRRRIV